MGTTALDLVSKEYVKLLKLNDKYEYIGDWLSRVIYYKQIYRKNEENGKNLPESDYCCKISGAKMEMFGRFSRKKQNIAKFFRKMKKVSSEPLLSVYYYSLDM